MRPSNNNPKRRLLSLIAALLCTVSIMTLAAEPAAAVTQSDIDGLKDDASTLSTRKKELKAKLNALSKDKNEAMNRKKLLDEQIAATVEEIENAEAQITSYGEMVSQKEIELAETQSQEEQQNELFRKRVRAMEKRGRVSYWSVLFKAESFSDLLGRLDAINEIMDSDQRVIQHLQDLQVELADKKIELEGYQKEAEDSKARLVGRKAELDDLREEANKTIQSLITDENETEADIAGLAEEEKAIQENIQRLSRELAEEEAKKAAENGQPAPSAALGGYIWPVPSRRITSTFGGRSSPGGIGSTDHKGVDIGGVGYTTEIKAAKAGTVIVSQLSSSYGNYVVVSHGSGNTTLYAHMSSRKVSVGQKVDQGDVLGITGSTGNSTGPHLHFEITENGVRINPLNYLTGYTLAG